MKPLDKDKACMQMNLLGKETVPFVFIIDFEMQENYVLPCNQADPDTLLYNLNGVTNAESQSKATAAFSFVQQPVSFDEYRRAFDAVCAEINEGNTYLLNLTFPTPVNTDLSLREIFFKANALYKLCFGGRFVVFSPEIFVRIRDGVISSFPMKGTIDASVPDAEKLILADPKETAEHNTIVDLIRNDLSMVADEVAVKRFRYIDRITTNRKDLLQVSSEISGKLCGDYAHRTGDIIFSLLPAGSVTGAPKKKTVEIIRKVEKDARGFYTGVCGHFDGRNLDSAVMIRFIEQGPGGKLIYRSGGGITGFSDAVSEYRELIDKVYVPVV